MIRWLFGSRKRAESAPAAPDASLGATPTLDASASVSLGLQRQKAGRLSEAEALGLGHGDAAQSAKYGGKVASVLSSLRRVESRRAELPALAGYVLLLDSEPAKAVPLFEDAMKINPRDPFVTYGADFAQRSLARDQSSYPRSKEIKGARLEFLEIRVYPTWG